MTSDPHSSVNRRLVESEHDRAGTSRGVAAERSRSLLRRSARARHQRLDAGTLHRSRSCAGACVYRTCAKRDCGAAARRRGIASFRRGGLSQGDRAYRPQAAAVGGRARRRDRGGARHCSSDSIVLKPPAFLIRVFNRVNRRERRTRMSMRRGSGSVMAWMDRGRHRSGICIGRRGGSGCCGSRRTEVAV